jgi:hypothetical protein
MKCESGLRMRRAFGLAVILLLLLSTSPIAWAGSSKGSAEDSARVETDRLIEKVWNVTRVNPTDPGAVPAWSGAVAGEPLLLHSSSGEPSEYLVPVIDGGGKVISTIGVSAESGKWEWYSGHYPLPEFPLVGAAEAEARVGGLLKSRGITASAPLPEARMEPDKLIYWCFKIEGDQPVKEVYLPAFFEDRPHTNLEAAPWKSERSVESMKMPAPPEDAGARADRRTDLVPLPSTDAYDIPGVPYHVQQNDVWCGPASLEMVFNYWGEDVSQSEIAGVANASSLGCYTDDLERAAHFSQLSTSIQNPLLHGYTARKSGYAVSDYQWSDGSASYNNRYSDLKKLIKNNYPVLALTYYSSSARTGHYRVVKGFSDPLNTFTVHDPWYTSPYFGPDVNFNQSFFVDDLWTDFNRWAMVAAPLAVSVEKPGSVAAGQTFLVSAYVNYPGPSPFNGQYPCRNPSATIQLSSDYQLAGGQTVSEAIGGLTSTGSSAAARWIVVAKSAKSSTDDISVAAGANVDGSSGNYPSYTDMIGGTGTGGVGTPFYFAEGCTRPGYETWLCIQNSSARDAQVNISYMLGNGQNFDQFVSVPALSRETVSVNDFLRSVTDPYQDVSTKVVSTNGAFIVVERPMYFNANGINGGHDVVGTNSPRNDWYFAEGNTYNWNREWLCLQNPGISAARVTVDFMLGNGTVETREYTVNPLSRSTVDVNAALGNQPADVSMKVHSEGSAIVAERPMYFNYKGKWDGGSNVMGATAPNTEWLFAEGNTRTWNDMWLCIQNPNDSAATVAVTYKSMYGPGTTSTYSVKPKSRYTISVNAVVGSNIDLGVDIHSDEPVIAERPMYFNYHDKWDGGHDVLGCNQGKTAWYLAEGCTRYDSQIQFDTWICIMNPAEPDTTATVTYMLGTGQNITRTYKVKADQRITVNVNNEVGSGQDVSAMVTCPVQIIVERPMYFNVRGDTGGHDVMGY